MMRAAPLVLLLLLAGCAGQSIACLEAVARRDCPPDSPAGKAMQEQRNDTQTFSDIDNARCSAYGNLGSQSYEQCRASIERERSRSATSPSK
jgi:hypothetical protein